MGNKLVDFLTAQKGINPEDLAGLSNAIVAVKSQADASGVENKDKAEDTATATQTALSLESVSQLIKDAIAEAFAINNQEVAEALVEVVKELKSVKQAHADLVKSLEGDEAADETPAEKQSVSWLIKSLAAVDEEKPDALDKDTVKAVTPRPTSAGKRKSGNLSDPSVFFGRMHERNAERASGK